MVFPYSNRIAADQFKVSYPDAAHDFPPQVRMQAYAFIDIILTPSN